MWQPALRDTILLKITTSHTNEYHLLKDNSKLLVLSQKENYKPNSNSEKIIFHSGFFSIVV